MPTIAESKIQDESTESGVNVKVSPRALLTPSLTSSCYGMSMRISLLNFTCGALWFKTVATSRMRLFKFKFIKMK